MVAVVFLGKNTQNRLHLGKICVCTYVCAITIKKRKGHEFEGQWGREKCNYHLKEKNLTIQLQNKQEGLQSLNQPGIGVRSSLEIGVVRRREKTEKE